MSKIKKALDGLYYSGLAKLFSPFFGGLGAIFMLHQVLPGGGQQKGFAPNAGLEITPEFLEAVIQHVRRRGYDTLSMDEAVRRIQSPEKNHKRFVVFTLDDAPRDNYIYAWPVFKRQNCPFTIYAVSSFLEGTGVLWWRAVEAVIAENKLIETTIGDQKFSLPARDLAEKKAAWKTLYWPIRNLNQRELEVWVRNFAQAHAVDVNAQCRSLSMSWNELREMANDPLCTIGGHTLHHHALGLLGSEDAILEVIDNRQQLLSELNIPITHFAYPYGDAESATPREFSIVQEAGYKTAVTTRKDLLHKSHSGQLMALPRLSLAGRYQKLRYIDVLLSGTATTLLKKYRKISSSIYD